MRQKDSPQSSEAPECSGDACAVSVDCRLDMDGGKSLRRTLAKMARLVEIVFYSVAHLLA